MENRTPRLFWACPYCLLDTSSGASIAVRELLSYLAQLGWSISILSASIFDVEAGIFRLRDHWDHFKENRGKIINVNDGSLKHAILSVESTNRFNMTTIEEDKFLALYTNFLDNFKPDLVFNYGGQVLDLLITNEASDRKIPVVSILANASYQATRWCRDVDLIVTDSKATAAMYAEKQGFHPTPIGTPINPSLVVANEHTRKNVLFVNPSWQKGVSVVATLAMILEEKRPDITFEIVESRGKWEEVLRVVTKAFGNERSSLSNVLVTPHTDDMKPIYGRARIVLAPSLCWESYGRVVAEAMMNGIPAIVSSRGGLPESMGKGGITVTFPQECCEIPYNQFLRPEILTPIANIIERFYDDKNFYQEYCQKALLEGQKSTTQAVANRFIEAVKPLLLK